MKNIFALSLMILAGYIAFSQSSVQNDPSYSVNNYKHPNKSAYAKKHNLDNMTTAEINETVQNDNYKQTFRKAEVTKKQAVKTEVRKDAKNRSYKHPYGL